MKKSGFTLIELIMVIVILGILSAIALPKFVDLSGNAKKAAAQGAIGAFRATLLAQFAQSAANGSPAYPSLVVVQGGTIFQEGVVPMNPLNPPSRQVVSTFNGTGGWVYYYNVNPNITSTVESNDALRTKL